jgi:hypothetical protein
MATMGAKKRMIGRLIQNKRMIKEDEARETHEKVMENTAVTNEEHQKRLDLLKSLGVLKK